MTLRLSSWQMVPVVLGLDAAVSVCLYQYFRVLYSIRSENRWHDVKGFLGWLCVGVGAFGAVFYACLLFHVFRA